MRPIPHRAHSSSSGGASRHTVDAIVADNPMPLGIPASFIVDQLLRGRPPEQILGGARGLIAEYAGVEGYAYRWGQLIEVRMGRYILWRVIPVAMWDHLAEQRAGSQLLIEELLTLVQSGVRPALRRHLPSDMLLAGCQGAMRHSPHALFGLLFANAAGVTAVRQWLSAPFLTDLLPHLLSSVERDITEVLRTTRS